MGIDNSALDKDLVQNFYSLFTTVDAANGFQFKHIKNYFSSLTKGIQYNLNAGASQALNLSDLQNNSTLYFNGTLTQNTTFTCASAITKAFRVVLNAAPSKFTLTLHIGPNSIVINSFNEDTYIAFTDPSDLDPTNNPAGATYTPYNALKDAFSSFQFANLIVGGTNYGIQWTHFQNYISTIATTLTATVSNADLTISNANLSNNSTIVLNGNLTANINVKNLSVDITKIYRIDTTGVTFNSHSITFRTKNWTAAAITTQGVIYLVFTNDQNLDISDAAPINLTDSGSPSTYQYTTVIGDNVKGIVSQCNTNSPVLTLPANIHPVGTKIPFIQYGTQQLLVQGDGTSQVQNSNGKFYTRAQYSSGYAWQVVANVWVLNGDMN